MASISCTSRGNDENLMVDTNKGEDQPSVTQTAVQPHVLQCQVILAPAEVLPEGIAGCSLLYRGQRSTELFEVMKDWSWNIVVPATAQSQVEMSEVRADIWHTHWTFKGQNPNNVLQGMLQSEVFFTGTDLNGEVVKEQAAIIIDNLNASPNTANQSFNHIKLVVLGASTADGYIAIQEMEFLMDGSWVSGSFNNSYEGFFGTNPAQVSSTSEVAGSEAYHAFSGADIGRFWRSGDIFSLIIPYETTSEVSLTVKFTRSVTITGARINGGSDNTPETQSPRSFYFMGSTDGIVFKKIKGAEFSNVNTASSSEYLWGN